MKVPLVVLVVSGETHSMDLLRHTLKDDFTVLTANHAEAASMILERELVHILLCDQRIPGASGIGFLKQVRAQCPDMVRIIITDVSNAGDTAAEINETGIWQYILKPWHPEQVLLTLRAAAELWCLRQTNQRLTLDLRTYPEGLRKRAKEKSCKVSAEAVSSRLVRAPDSPLNDVCRMAERVALYEMPILITGESGTGKELLACAVHYASRRAGGAFVVENCGALPDSLLESELFGHKRGAYTGAFEDHMGLFQQAHGGTIFLDEIGDTSPAFQVKLLRALQEGEIRPVGSPRPISVDVRVIAATNRDLQADVRSGRFREDLYYRLAGMSLRLPSLRERPQDIPLIAAKLLEQGRLLAGKPAAQFKPETLQCLCKYAWPGNVRELQNEVLRMLALAEDDALSVELLSPPIRAVLEGAQPERGSNTNLHNDFASETKRLGLHVCVEQIEAEVIRKTLEELHGNKSRAAEALGISRVGLRAKLARYGLR